jgi:acyl-[acyl-carrier-protein]-phospholipid O-acyltransferase/long-chain-fatty-acid--[acyl-carrier-protein] ligase
VNETAAAPESPPAITADPHQLPRLLLDTSFWGMTATQFLGAFNDNLYKQLVLLICLDYVQLRGLADDPYQMYAQGMFALAFVLLSGFAGWLSDRYSKRTIVVLSKVGEIAVMGAGLTVFGLFDFGTDTYLIGLMFVLFLMGAQSAFFGPAKYGILPEMLRDDDLPLANGIVQMTTFLAIIFGTAVCGLLKTAIGETFADLWKVSAACVLVAVIGTLTSLLVRRTRVAEPGLPFHIRSLWMDRPTVAMLRGDRTLLGVLLAIVLFWFLGGVSLPAVNTLGKEQFGLGDGPTSLLTACIGFGIAIGCVIAGLASKHRIRFDLVRLGAWGMFITFAAIALLPTSGLADVEHSLSVLKGATSAKAKLLVDPGLRTSVAAVLLAAMGLFAGIFAVPLQTFLQTRPPREQKGRMIAAMNICTWLGILAAAGAYGLCSKVFTNESISHTFGVLAALILPLALFYRPQDQVLGEAP